MAEPITLTVALFVFLVFSGMALLIHGFKLVDTGSYYEGDTCGEGDVYPPYTLHELYTTGQIQGGVMYWLGKFMYGDLSLYVYGDDEAGNDEEIIDASDAIDDSECRRMYHEELDEKLDENLRNHLRAIHTEDEVKITEGKDLLQHEETAVQKRSREFLKKIQSKPHKRDKQGRFAKTGKKKGKKKSKENYVPPHRRRLKSGKYVTVHGHYRRVAG